MTKMNLFFYSFCGFSLLLLASCSTNKAAPVVDGWKQTNAESNSYRVQADDTIYSVAWAFGMDYRALAKLNNLQEPFTLHEGQTLRMSASTAPNQEPTQKAVAIAQAVEPQIVPDAPKNTATAAPAKKTIKTTTTWLWPTKGSVLHGFSAAPGGNKGLDISGTASQPVTATATGKVVYTGASLPGYGNLVIIKHSENELSAYAFNKVIEVKEGQMVKAGQTIARMGNNESGQAVLHFEIRKNGKPIDPMPYLAK